MLSYAIQDESTLDSKQNLASETSFKLCTTLVVQCNLDLTNLYTTKSLV